MLAAREWVGTPFHHQGRVKGVGVDCIGLIVEVGREVGLVTGQWASYPRHGDGTALTAGLEEHLDWVEKPALGDVLLLRRGRFPRHVGIASDIGMIHADGELGRVVETPFKSWVEALEGAYTWRPRS